MARPFTSRLFKPITTSICSSCRTTLTQRRPFSHTSAILAKDFIDPLSSFSALSNIASDFNKPSSGFEDIIGPRNPRDSDGLDELTASLHKEVPMYHFHVYATKHNTHITLTRPNREPIISVSCGNIGFRKAARGTYDSGYQLAAYVMSRIQDQGLLTEIRDMEVVFRGFGPGREAVSKVILSSEGRNVRNKIKKLTDATRLKFGGTRSPKPRRLG